MNSQPLTTFPAERRQSGDKEDSSGIIYDGSHIHDVVAPLVQPSEVTQTTPRPEPIAGGPSFLESGARYPLPEDISEQRTTFSNDPTLRPSGFFPLKFGEILSRKVAEIAGLKDPPPHRGPRGGGPQGYNGG